MAKAKIQNPTVEEGLKALAGLRNMTSYDIEAYVHDKDPNYHYHLVNKKTQRIDNLKVRGYETVTPYNDKAKAGSWNEGAGAWMISGDRILMRVRKEYWDREQVRRAARFTAARDEARQLFVSDAAKVSSQVGKEVTVDYPEEEEEKE